jgi:N-acyl-D-amino-acid deacylase
MFDYLITNVSILDGLGGPAFNANVAISAGRIAAIGNVNGRAKRMIDGDGLIATPGFIDIHSHTDAGLLIDPTAQSKLTQGITLEVCGNCGFSPAPCLDDSGRSELDDWRERHGIEESWQTTDEFLSVLESRSIGVNFVMLVGHSNLRAAVVGLADKEATPEDIDKMKLLAAAAMQEGAFGLSTGLQYPPSCFGSTEEIAQVASAVAPFGGIYSSHIRDESSALAEAVAEAIEIGRCGGVPVQISHLKGYGSDNPEKTRAVLEMIEDARRAGLDVTADQYPYTASSTGLSIFLPKWAHDGGDEAMLERIRTRRQELVNYLKMLSNKKRRVADAGLWEGVRISSVKSEANRQYEGMSVVEISRARNVLPEEAVIDLLGEEDGAVSIVHFSQWEGDVVAVMRSEFAMFGTDASARSTTGELSKGKPHPRSFGSFPRVLGRYVREQGVISFEKAVRKMTSMSARKLGLVDRGTLREGNWADVTVFDPDEVIDTATYEQPHQPARGIAYVFVNGQLAVENGELTGALAGRVLRRNSAASRIV